MGERKAGYRRRQAFTPRSGGFLDCEAGKK